MFEYAVHSQQNAFPMLRNKQFCSATLGSFNIHVAHVILCLALKELVIDFHHTLAIFNYLDDKNLFLVLLFRLRCKGRWHLGIGALYLKLQDVQHLALRFAIRLKLWL